MQQSRFFITNKQMSTKYDNTRDTEYDFKYGEYM